jgi:hypothetical protein
LGPIPNPQSPIPNPQSPIPNPHFITNFKYLRKILYSFIFMEDKSKKIEFINDKSLSNIYLNYIHFNNSIIKSTTVPENTDKFYFYLNFNLKIMIIIKINLNGK